MLFQAFAQEVPLPDWATELSTYQVAALPEINVKKNIRNENLILAGTERLALRPMRLKVTKHLPFKNDQKCKKQLFIKFFIHSAG